MSKSKLITGAGLAVLFVAAGLALPALAAPIHNTGPLPCTPADKERTTTVTKTVTVTRTDTCTLIEPPVTVTQTQTVYETGTNIIITQTQTDTVTTTQTQTEQGMIVNPTLIYETTFPNGTVDYCQLYGATWGNQTYMNSVPAGTTGNGEPLSSCTLSIHHIPGTP